MPNELKEIDNELYFCRYLNKDNARYDSIVSGRFILVFTLSGNARFLLNDKAFDIDKSKFLLLHPHVESRIESLSDDFRACCIGSIMELQNSVTYNIPPTFLAMVLQRPVWAMDETTMRAAHAFCTLFDYNYSYVKGQMQPTLQHRYFRSSSRPSMRRQSTNCPLKSRRRFR